MEPSIISKIGDSQVSLSDMRRLVRPVHWSGSERQFWITDEVVNIMTNLFAMMNTTEGTFFFSSILMQHVLENNDASRLSRILDAKDISRNGQKWTFQEVSVSFAPCFVNRNHWMGFRVTSETFSIQGVNSISDSSTGKIYGTRLTSFLQKVDGKPWKYVGDDETFPIQRNGMDCGILVLIGARNWALGVDMDENVSQVEWTTLWRERFAHEIMVLRSS